MKKEFCDMLKEADGIERRMQIERKIIQLADTTKAVTLPRKWTLDNKLEKGGTLELFERGNFLLINASKNKIMDVDLDFTGLDEDLIWRHLITVYRKGAKRVTIRFKNKKDLETIQRLAKDLLGMVIVKQYRNTLIMKDMFENDHIDIDEHLKKIFTLLMDLSKDSYESVKNKDQLGLENTQYQDFNINKFANLAIRFMNLNGYHDIDKAYSIYKIISILEEIGDEYRRLSLVYARLRNKVSGNVLNCFRGVNDLLEIYYNLYYKFNKEDLRKFYEKANTTLRRMKKIYNQGNNVDVQILSSLDTILHLIKNLSEENMVVKL